MSINGEPSFQYADADNLFEHTGDPELNEALESASQTLYSAESLLATLESVKHRLQTEKVIDRTTANTLKTLTTSMESMQEHFSRHPVRSYTERPSATNLNPTLEGLVTNIVKAVWEAITSVFKFIYNFVKDLVGLKQKKKSDLEKVQKGLSEDLKELSKKKVDVVIEEKPATVEGAAVSTDREQPGRVVMYMGSPSWTALSNAIMNLPPMISQAVYKTGPTDEFMIDNGGIPGLIVKIEQTEKHFLEWVKSYATQVKNALGHVQRLVDIHDKGDGNHPTDRYVAALYEGVKAIEFRPPGYDGVVVKEADGFFFGEQAKAYITEAHSKFSNIKRLPFDVTDGLLDTMGRILTLAKTSKLDTAQFIDPREYTKVGDNLDGIYNDIQAIKRRFADNRVVAHSISAISRDVKAASDSMLELESTINLFRIAAGRLLAVTHTYRKIVGE